MIQMVTNAGGDDHHPETRRGADRPPRLAKRFWTIRTRLSLRQPARVRGPACPHRGAAASRIDRSAQPRSNCYAPQRRVVRPPARLAGGAPERSLVNATLPTEPLSIGPGAYGVIMRTTAPLQIPGDRPP